MTAIFSCTWPQTVAPKGHTHMALFSRKDTWMNLFALKLLHLRVHINTNDSNFSCFQTVAPKGHTHMALFSRKDTWMNFFALKLLHLRVHINTNDSNFLLYRGPDSCSPKGPFTPKLIDSVEQIHEWTFLHWNYMLEFIETPMTATFSCTGAQTVAHKGHMPPNWFIQPNRYMNEWHFI